MGIAVALACLAGVDPRAADAQETSVPQIEVPILVLEGFDTGQPYEEEQDLSQVVFSAAKRVQSVQETSSIVTVVTREQIRVRGYRTLGDILDDIPGFEGVRPAFYFDSSEAFARGNARTILVLWNGVPLNSPQENRRALGQYLPLDVIDRVEVISGPGGVLWGANAFLGIVAVTTLRADRAGTLAELSGGGAVGPDGDGRYHASASFAGSVLGGRVRLFGNVSLITTLGPVVTPPYDLVFGPFPAPDSDGTFALGPSSGASHNARDTWVPLMLAVDAGPLRFDLLYPLVARQFREFNDRGLRTDQYLDASGELALGESSRREETLVVASLSYDKRLSRGARVVARGYFTGFEDRWNRLVQTRPGLIGAIPTVTHERYDGMSAVLHDGAYRAGLTLDGSYDFRRSQLLAGGELYREGMRAVHREVTGSVAVDDFLLVHSAQRLVMALFVADRLELGKRLSMEAGARGQYAPGSYDPLLLGSVAARWSPFGKTNLKLNVAQGFRPPAFAFVAGNDDPLTNPFAHRASNPELAAERSLSVEGELSAMVLQGVGRLRYAALRLGYQYTQIDDLVVFRVGAVPANANRRVMNSVELRADLALTGNHRMVFGYTFLTGVDAETGPLRNIPQHRLISLVEAHLAPHVDAHLGLILVGAVEDLNRLPVSRSSGGGSSAPASSVAVDRLPPAGILNAGVVVSGLWKERLDAALHVTNVTNAHYLIADPDFERRQSIFPMAAPGVSATLSLTWRIE